MGFRSGLVAGLLALVATTTGAANIPIRGMRFVVSDPTSSPRDRAVQVRGKETGLDVALRGDPITLGATLTLYVLGATSSEQVIVLPGIPFANGVGWRVRRGRRGRGSFVWSDQRGVHGPVRSLRLVRGKKSVRLVVDVSGKRSAETIALRPPNPGREGGLTLDVGDGDRWCVTFGGDAGGAPGPDDARRFRVRLVGRSMCPHPPPTPLGSFVTFETGQVRPLALSLDGTRLFALNTPDARLEVFDVDEAGDLAHAASVPVGLEPVAIAVRSDDEVWVVNHLSDSVSIVRLDGAAPRVVRTLLVGDEPRDVVFAGPERSRAFVTTAHRGQNSGVPAADLVTPGIGRADVWVFDAADQGPSLGGAPLTVINLFGDTPRALAVSPDGAMVYAAVFHSGNRTATVGEGLVCNGGAGAGACFVGDATAPGGLPAPSPRNCAGETQPETGLIVRFEPALGWRDELGRDWSDVVRFDLPDEDVFAIDATANPPMATGVPWTGVGTVLFNLTTNPASGKVYVSNTDARNEVRFEGPGGCSTTVQGRLHQARITVLDGSSVLPRHLNPHIDYGQRPAPPAVKARSLATPLDMVVSSDGATLWVAAFGSGKVAALSTAALEAGTLVPDDGDHVTVTGGGPSGLALGNERLYVLTRFDNGVSVIDTTTRSEVGHVTFHNPEPAAVVAGRPVLYDARATSTNGEASCSACHVFGDLDSLAWDLGNPDDTTIENPNPIRLADPFGGAFTDFAPMKGPMTTQSLRGLAHQGPMHWRGDRTGGNDPGGDALDEVQAFRKFIVAFEGLLGRDAPIPDADMARFTDFILRVIYPPNPIRNLDNSLTPAQQAGRILYFGRNSDIVFNCNGCHTLDPARGFFGGDGQTTFEMESQLLKVAHLRNLYQKVGMFGLAQTPFIKFGNNGFQGPQVRGFGFLHDGSIDTLFRFHRAGVFDLSEAEARDVEQLMLAFDSTLAPIVGQQVTLTGTNAGAVGPRLDLLRERAQMPFVIVGDPLARECDLVVKGILDGVARGWLLGTDGTFRTDRQAEPPVTEATLRAQAAVAGQELTYTCVPPGSGVRAALDRDEDGCLDGDDPAPADAALGCG